VQNVSVWSRWLRSFYWGITTLTTVGFGDISASTEGEMLFAAFAELIGTMVFGTLVGTVGSIIGRRRLLEDRHESQVEEIKEFMQSKHIPLALQADVRKYLRNNFKFRRAFDERRHLSMLPPQLMFGMLQCLYEKSVWKSSFFRGLGEEVMAEICFALLPVVASPGEIVFRIGDVAREGFVIMSGRVEIVTSSDRTHLATHHADELDGRVFGQVGLVTAH
jgi:hypothetical protein